MKVKSGGLLLNSSNPFAKIGTIMTYQQIMDYAINRLQKMSFKLRPRLKAIRVARFKESERITYLSELISSKLLDIVRYYPSIDHLHPFYIELADILIGINKLKQALGAVNGAAKAIIGLGIKYSMAAKHASTPSEAAKIRRAAMGRIASVLRKTNDKILLLIEAKTVLSKLPSIDPFIPTIVCAGSPNVGKSTLVRKISTAEPEVAFYPFTTRSIIVGHTKIGDKRIQIVDTPGILDRPPSNRNLVEKQAVVALKYLANIIIQLIDPSETCGFPIDEQINLYHEIRRTFPTIPLIPVLNKVDIASKKQINYVVELIPEIKFHIIAESGKGIDELMKYALEQVTIVSE